MSILIKGMDKPKSCTLCELMKNGGNSFYCPLQSKEANLKASLLIELYVNCPLISIPPHGDLVDRDEMREIAISLLDEAVTDQEANAIREMWSRLGKMPVYIPAEESE